jgi:anti-sigma factor RsiW
MSELQIFQNPPQPPAAPPAAMEEFALLMSLALDGLLDAAEQRRFDALLDGYPELAEEWDEWRAIDVQLASLPRSIPAPGFVDRFEQRLAAQDARQQHRVIGLSVAATLVTMAVVMVTLVSTGAAAFSAQSVWIGEQLHNLAYSLVLVDRWLNTLVSTALVMSGTPQARLAGLVYTVMVMAMIFIWAHLVRRSGDSQTAPSLLQ